MRGVADGVVKVSAETFVPTSLNPLVDCVDSYTLYVNAPGAPLAIQFKVMEAAPGVAVKPLGEGRLTNALAIADGVADTLPTT
jgi:hypothetical protein